MCEATQLKLIEGKVKHATQKENAAALPKVKDSKEENISAKGNASDKENVLDNENISDKENASPKEASRKKRRSQLISSGKGKASKVLPLRPCNNINLNVDSERRTRSYLGKLEPVKGPQKVAKRARKSPKSTPVPVIVKRETLDNSRPDVVTTEKQASDIHASNGPVSDVHANELVWIPHPLMLPAAETPRSANTGERHDRSPTAGDEPEQGVERTPDKCSTSVVEKQTPPTGSVPESVAEPTVHAARTDQTPGATDARRSASPEKKPKAETKGEAASEVGNDKKPNETPRKFAKISELITEDQKRVIETRYSVAMSAVDQKVVTGNMYLDGVKHYRCKICRTLYNRVDKCRVHIWGHLNMKPYRCRTCAFSTVTVSNIRCHIRKSHLKIKPYVCEHCGKRYTTAFLMEEHLNTHTGARPYSCNLCDFTSGSRQVLSYHTATHKPTKDIICDDCGKSFYSKARLRAHSVIHNKDRVANMCKLCSIYLCSSESLERHNAKVHSKMFFCDNCDKSCKTKKALINHMVVHWPAKHHCTICGHSYKSSHILKEHILKHKGIRKYKCTVCERTFAQQSHLAAHMAVHSDVRFHCPGCNRAFNRHDNMKAHTKRCKIFLEKPELVELLKIRKPRTKTANTLRTNLDSAATAPQEVQKTVPTTTAPQEVQRTVVATTDGPFLKVELVDEVSNENAAPHERA